MLCTLHIITSIIELCTEFIKYYKIEITEEFNIGTTIEIIANTVYRLFYVTMFHFNLFRNEVSNEKIYRTFLTMQQLIYHIKI